MTLDKSLTLPEPQFNCWSNGSNDAYFMLLGDVNETTYACHTVSRKRVAANLSLPHWASNSSFVNGGQLLLPGTAIVKMN